MLNPFLSILPPRVDTVSSFLNFHTRLDVLRLDLVHPVVSGNKWYKLSHYIADAKKKNKTTLLTFGGAYSNHIVATAAAAKMEGLNSIGIIRGEEPVQWSHTLKNAASYGMRLLFSSRADYRLKTIPGAALNNGSTESIFVIPEGGYGPPGAAGIEALMRNFLPANYSHLITAVGTGTTAAGLVNASCDEQVLGIPVLKNNNSLLSEINALVTAEKQSRFQLIEDFHFGGYAKKTPELISFMNSFYEATGIPTDFVYTGKMFFAIYEMLKFGLIPSSASILAIHTGGLQGNASLPKGTLIF